MFLRKLVFPFAIALFLGFALSEAIAQTYIDLHDFVCATEGCYPQYPEMLAQGRDGNLYGTMQFGGTSNYGTVFKVTPSGVLTVLYKFDLTTGSNPSGGLTLGLDGNFYGTTQSGGAYGWGTVFKISPAGTLTTLHNFSPPSEGNPWAPPILGVDGNYYGVTNGGIAYKISAKGVFKTLGSIPQSACFPLMQASDGSFYGPLPASGVCGSIFKMSKAGAMTTFYTFDGTHGCEPVGPLVQDSKGYLYGVTAEEGAYNFGTIFKLTTKRVLTELYDFDGTTGHTPFGGLVLANSGNFYGGTSAGGSQDLGVLFQLTPTNNYTVLYDAGPGNAGSQFTPTPMQHTNGIVYGLAGAGGAHSGGVLYSLDVGLPPFIALMSTSGTPGQTVEILGQGFNSASSVKFGTGSANFNAVSDTYMTAVIPAEGTQGYVTVTTGSGTLTSNKKFKVVPIINSFTPSSGPVGTKVTITGGGFHGATKVTFGGVKAASFSVDSGSQITATVPTGAVTGKIKVTTAGGTATSKGTFTVT